MKSTYLYLAIIFLIGIAVLGMDYYIFNGQINNDVHYYKGEFKYENIEPYDVVVM